MNKLLSILTARPLSLLFPAALVACFLAPNQAIGSREMRVGSDHIGGSEGDPLDTNDFGGGGGGDEVTIQTGSKPDGSGGYLSLDFSSMSVLLVPEFQGGTLIFRIIFVENSALDLNSGMLEGYHAP